MNKDDFIKLLCSRTNISKANCKKVFEETIEIIKESFYTGVEIGIKNFGKFSYREFAERKRYLPSLKVVKTEKPKVLPRFIPSKGFYGKIL